mmetsp:Transcript_36101/g.73813  ORF Transcript_36101/g.73813 Transcript_36101/m.73813 type:complete len:93 (-) Transcript_36101:249-527(-)
MTFHHSAPTETHTAMLKTMNMNPSLYQSFRETYPPPKKTGACADEYGVMDPNKFEAKANANTAANGGVPVSTIMATNGKYNALIWAACDAKT